MPALRIDNLNPGDIVTLRFIPNHGDPWNDNVRYVGISGQGDDRQATFAELLPEDPTSGGDEFNIYRYKGHWAYGTSAERVSLYGMCTQVRERDIEDIITAASEAFFASLAASFPQIKSGDLDPMSTREWDHHSRQVARAWIFGNMDDSYIVIPESAYV